MRPNDAAGELLELTMKRESRYGLFAVVGRPIFPSRSPELYNRAFNLQKIKANYVRLAAHNLEESLATVRELNLAGFNVTAPYKEKIISYLDELDERAVSVAAVNTVLRQGNRLKGFNTDPDGFALAAKGAGINLNQTRVLVLGAGGAARAVLYALRQAGAGAVLIANRSGEKAKKLADEFGYSFVPASELKKNLGDFSLLVSCLPRTEYLLLYGQIPRECRLIEASYSAYGENGRKVSPEPGFNGSYKASLTSGLEWLLGQAVSAFRLFTGQELTPEEIEDLRSRLSRPRPKKKNVAVVGFMGCGKSSLGRLIAARLGWDFQDTDELIEAQTGQTIEAIFAKQGEAEFRKIEARLLPSILLTARHTVFALGGGAVKCERVRRALAACCHVIWLWAPLEACLKRVLGNGRNRPVLTLNSSFASRKQLFWARVPLYAGSSDLLVANREGRLEQTARLIHEEISPSL